MTAAYYYGNKSVPVPKMETRKYNRKIRKARRHFKITFAAKSFPPGVPPSEEYSPNVEEPWNQYLKSGVYTRWHRRRAKKNTAARGRQNLNKIAIGDKVELDGFIGEVLQRLGRKTFKVKVLGYIPQVSRPMDVYIPQNEHIGNIFTIKVRNSLYTARTAPVDVYGYAAKHIEYCDVVLSTPHTLKDEGWGKTWLECRAMWFCLGWNFSAGVEFDSWRARKLIGVV